MKFYNYQYNTVLFAFTWLHIILILRKNYILKIILNRIIVKVQQCNETNLIANKSFQKLHNFYHPSGVSSLGQYITMQSCVSFFPFIPYALPSANYASSDLLKNEIRLNVKNLTKGLKLSLLRAQVS